MHLRDRRRALLPALLCLCGLGVLASAAAQDNPLEVAADPVVTRTGNPLDPDPAWAGVWVDESRGVGIVLLPHETSPDACEGIVLVLRREEARRGGREATYELEGKVAGDRVEGTFKDQGKAFPFKASLEGGVLVLESGKATFRLPRARETGSLTRVRRQIKDRRAREGGASGNEAAAIGALKTLNSAQTLFREGDKEQDGQLDYGSLAELSRTSLIDAVLGSGKKAGYVFDCRASVATPEFLWFATAAPEQPGTSGSRYFVTNHSGVIYYSTERPFEVNPDSCAIPEGATPVGK